jgi:hypothetical protein
MKCPAKEAWGDHKAKSVIDQLAASKAMTLYFGAEMDDVPVFGHTHESDSAFGTVNRLWTGSRKKSTCEEYRFLEIKDGRVLAKSFRWIVFGSNMSIYTL